MDNQRKLQDQASECLARVLMGESINEAVDKTTENAASPSGFVDTIPLERGLDYVEIQVDSTRLRAHSSELKTRNGEYFERMREILKLFELEIDYIHNTLSTTDPSAISFKHVASGFYTAYHIFCCSILVGKVEIIGPFYDRSTDVKLDLTEFRKKIKELEKNRTET